MTTILEDVQVARDAKDTKLHTLLSLSRRLGLPPAWLKAEANAGRIPCLKIGRNNRRFNAEAVERVLAERAAEAKAMPADDPPLMPWTELDQLEHSLRQIELAADSLRGLGLAEIADKIIAHTKELRRWIAAHH